jgi:putative hemolysin
MALPEFRDLIHAEIQVEPRDSHRCEGGDVGPSDKVELPALSKSYLQCGPKVCGPPAIDKRFGAIRFFTLLDVQSLPPRSSARTVTNKRRSGSSWVGLSP